MGCSVFSLGTGVSVVRVNVHSWEKRATDTGWTPQALNSHHPWAKTWKNTVTASNRVTANEIQKRPDSVSLEWLCEAKPFQSSTMDWLCEAKQSNQNGLALRSKANPSLKRLCEAKPIHHDGKALRSKANPS